ASEDLVLPGFLRIADNDRLEKAHHADTLREILDLLADVLHADLASAHNQIVERNVLNLFDFGDLSHFPFLLACQTTSIDFGRSKVKRPEQFGPREERHLGTWSLLDIVIEEGLFCLQDAIDPLL